MNKIKKILCILVGILFLVFGFFINHEKNYQKEYEIKRNADYKAILKPNEFYEENELPKNYTYPSKLLSTYEIKMNYQIKALKKLNVSYYVILQLVGEVENSSNEEKIWEKEYQVKELRNLENQNEYNIEENISINYQKYNELARLYEKENAILIKATLKVQLVVLYEEKTDITELDISLNNNVSNVTENYEKETIINKNTKVFIPYMIMLK